MVTIPQPRLDLEKCFKEHLSAPTPYRQNNIGYVNQSSRWNIWCNFYEMSNLDREPRRFYSVTDFERQLVEWKVDYTKDQLDVLVQNPNAIHFGGCPQGSNKLIICKTLADLRKCFEYVKENGSETAVMMSIVQGMIDKVNERKNGGNQTSMLPVPYMHPLASDNVPKLDIGKGGILNLDLKKIQENKNSTANNNANVPSSFNGREYCASRYGYYSEHDYYDDWD